MSAVLVHAIRTALILGVAVPAYRALFNGDVGPSTILENIAISLGVGLIGGALIGAAVHLRRARRT